MLLTTVAVAAASAAPGTATEATPPTPTPGHLALLAEGELDENALDLMKAALADPDPALRAAGARMIAVLGAMELLPVVRTALAGETSSGAALEEARALAQTGQWEDLRVAVEAAERIEALGEPVSSLIALAMGPEAVPLYPLLPRQARRTQSVLANFFRQATTGNGSELNRAARLALATKDGLALMACLDAAISSRVRLAPGLLEEILEQLPPAMVGEAAWSFARSWAAGPPEEAADLLGVVEAYTSAHAKALGDEEALGLDMLARVLGAKGTSGKRWVRHISRAETTHLDSLGDSTRILHGYLRRSERSALEDRMEQKPDLLPTSPRIKGLVLSKREARKLSESYRQALEEHVTPIAKVILPAHPDGMFTGILDLTGCTPPWNRAAVAAEIAFGPEGRPVVETETVWGEPLEPCRRAASLLFRTSLQSLQGLHAGSGRRNIVIFLLNGARMACYTNPEPPADPSEAVDFTVAQGPTDLSGGVSPPRRIRKVDPAYPRRMRSERASGKVILEIVVRRDGCVEEMKILRSGGFDFDMAASWAVSQWHYEPARREDKPVKVYMAVVVDFKIK